MWNKDEGQAVHTGSAAPNILFLAIILMMNAALPLHSQASTPARSLTFSGYKWDIRHTVKPEGPMGNQFGGDAGTAVLNAEGSVTLSIAYKDGVWRASEVTTQKNFGYGTYLFRLRTPPSGLDPQAVLGLFTYSKSSAYSHREIDIELSAWGMHGVPVHGQYVIQPGTAPGHFITYDLSRIEGPATYAFIWSEGRVDFATWKGYGQWPQPGSPDLFSTWSFIDAKAVPKPSSRIHMNLYLADGSIPPISASGQPGLSVTIDSFEFIPAKK